METHKLPLGASLSYAAIERRKLILGVQPMDGALALVGSAFLTLLVRYTAGVWWAVPIFPIVFGGLYVLFRHLCRKNSFWFEYTFGGHGYSNKLWIKG